MYHIVTRKPPPPEPDESEKKERVLHTRVPERLEAELRERAESLGISVSNLVRNVLGHAFGLLGDVAADAHAISRAARGERAATSGENAASKPEPAPTAAIADVLAWQPIVLGKNAVCARCNALLPRGNDAAIGDANPRLIVCIPCLEELRR
jgi:hypothetical protein